MGYLISENSELIIIKTNRRMRELNISSLDAFRLISVIDALPLEWCELLTTFVFKEDKHCNLRDGIKLSLNGQIVSIEKVVSKTVYKERRDGIISQLLNRNLRLVLLMKLWNGKKFIVCFFALP